MAISSIQRDGDKYQELDLEINDFIDNFPDEYSYQQAHDFSTENISLADWWQPLATAFIKIEDGGDKIPDISRRIDASLVLSPKAHWYLDDSLAQYGDLLPFHVEGEMFYICN